MKKIGRITAGIAALSLMTAFSGCGEASNAPAETSVEITTTTAATVERNTETLNEEAQANIDNTSDKLIDMELENKTVKWFAHYDPFNPSSSGNSKSVSLSYFESKYGGSVKWYPTTWENRYADLSTYVLGGEGIDFFDCDTNALPSGIISGMFQPVDDYIDLNSELWSTVSKGMDVHKYNGKHYELVNSITAESVLFYSFSTIKENGFDDPAELWEKGEWNWDSFKKMLMAYVDPEKEHYGLDSWYNEKALFLSAGVPLVSSDNSGRLVSNLDNETVKKAMDFQYSLGISGLAMNLGDYNWTPQVENMGSGKELFYIVGSWDFQSAPEIWSTKMTPSDVRMVPVPSPAGSTQYVGTTLGGWCLCKGADNPVGVARFAECALLANIDEEAIAISDQKYRDDFGWTDTMIDSLKKINAIAAENPVVDLAAGISSDFASVTYDGGDFVGLKAALHGTAWDETKSTISEPITNMLNDANRDIAAAQ